MRNVKSIFIACFYVTTYQDTRSLMKTHNVLKCQLKRHSQTIFLSCFLPHMEYRNDFVLSFISYSLDSSFRISNIVIILLFKPQIRKHRMQQSLTISTSFLYVFLPTHRMRNRFFHLSKCMVVVIRISL